MSLNSTCMVAARRAVMSGVAALVLASAIPATSPAQASPAPSSAGEEVIIRAPDIVRRPIPRTGQGAPPGLTNPEIISLTRAVSYSDLDLSTAAGAGELRARVTNTARDVCQELNRLYPRTGGQYVYSSTDCVQKATSDAMDVVNQITTAARR